VGNDILLLSRFVLLYLSDDASQPLHFNVQTPVLTRMRTVSTSGESRNFEGGKTMPRCQDLSQIHKTRTICLLYG